MIIVAITLIIFVALLPALMTSPSLSVDTFGFALLSAWLGTGMIAASLLMMIRESFWSAWFGGLQHMYQWHHRIGITGVVFLLVHPLLLAIDYWPLGLTSAWEYLPPFDSDLINVLGWTALIMFVLGLSVNFNLNLPYSVWRRLHLSLIVAMALGLWHIWIVGGFSSALIAVLIPTIISVAWRFMRADQGIGARPYEVDVVHHPTEYITEATLRPLAKPVPVIPSQFVNAAFLMGLISRVVAIFILLLSAVSPKMEVLH